MKDISDKTPPEILIHYNSIKSQVKDIIDYIDAIKNIIAVDLNNIDNDRLGVRINALEKDRLGVRINALEKDKKIKEEIIDEYERIYPEYLI